MRGLAFAFTSLLFATAAHAHDTWANGDPVPGWVKRSCCGPTDAHRLDPSQVSEDDQGYVVESEGKTFRVPREKALPSQDAHYWIFYSNATSPLVYCLFVLQGS